MLDFVQIVSDRVGQMAGLDEDALHWVGVAIRESVINAIKHGNRQDQRKQVVRRVRVRAAERPRRALVISVVRRGRGLRARGGGRPAGAREHAQVERPRHLLHAQLHGRRRHPAPARGRHGSAAGEAPAGARRSPSTPDPAFPLRRHHGACRGIVPRALACRAPPCPSIRSSAPPPSTPCSTRAAIQMRHFRRDVRHRQEGHQHRPRDRGRPRGRARVPGRRRRAVPRPRRPRRGVLEPGRRGAAAGARAGCSTRSTARPTTPTGCRSSARRSDSRSTAWRCSGPSTTRRATSCSWPSGARARR